MTDAIIGAIEKMVNEINLRPACLINPTVSAKNWSSIPLRRRHCSEDRSEIAGQCNAIGSREPAAATALCGKTLTCKDFSLLVDLACKFDRDFVAVKLVPFRCDC